MRYDDQNLQEILAAEYVLGTLRGPARRRYEALLQTRPDWRQATDWWASRLHLLALTSPPATPAPRVWRNIESRLFGSRVTSQATGWWRALALGSSALALVMAFLLADTLQRPPVPSVVVSQPALVALMNNEEAKPAWLLSLARNADGEAALRVVTLPGATPIEGKSFELWVLPPDKSAPISLGLMPLEGTATLQVVGDVATLLQQGGLAVSLEPAGGSPTGQPTGTVLYHGKLAAI